MSDSRPADSAYSACLRRIRKRLKVDPTGCESRCIEPRSGPPAQLEGFLSHRAQGDVATKSEEGMTCVTSVT